jgi:hypothetical protein
VHCEGSVVAHPTNRRLRRCCYQCCAPSFWLLCCCRVRPR